MIPGHALICPTLTHFIYSHGCNVCLIRKTVNVFNEVLIHALRKSLLRSLFWDKLVIDWLMARADRVGNNKNPKTKYLESEKYSCF